MNWQQFVERLQAENLISGDSLPERSDESTPWYLSIAPALGAWFAALFLLSFVAGFLLAVWNSPILRGIFGIALCAIAIKLGKTSAFRSQFALVFSLAGLALITTSIHESSIGWQLTTVLFAASCALLGWLNSETVHRRLMAFLTVLALVAAGVGWRLEPALTLVCAVATVALWVRHAHWATRNLDEFLMPLAGATAFALIALQSGDALPGSWLMEAELGRMLSPRLWRAAILAVALAATGLLVARKLGAQSTRDDLLIILACALLASATWLMPGILAGLLAWLLGVWAGRSLLRNIGIAGSATYLLTQYYTLDTTLMQKGVSLMATGIALGVGAFIVSRLYPNRGQR